MYLIISKDKRIPPDLNTFDYEVWSSDEFVEKASEEEGFNTDNLDLIYYNIDSLSQEIYEALKAYTDAGYINVVYYKFSDVDITLNFSVEEGIKEFDVTPPVSDEPEADEVEDEPKEQEKSTTVPEKPNYSIVQGVEVLTPTEVDSSFIDMNRLDSLMDEPENDDENRRKNPAKVIMFGSSKGGTGKTFTCLITAARFAMMHPNLKVALADFDIIDGQIGININKVTPTMADFYKQYLAGNDTFMYFSNCLLHNENFSSNLDFYLAPPMDVPEITENTNYWKKVFELLILNYDVVFFDTGIDYLGKEPISMLYRIADKIILTSNTSINSVKSIVKQLKTIGGLRKNPVFNADEGILDRTYIVLTRVSNDPEINNAVVKNMTKYVPIVAAFGNIDSTIAQVQWYQKWDLILRNPSICKYLDAIAELDDVE